MPNGSSVTIMDLIISKQRGGNLPSFTYFYFHSILSIFQFLTEVSAGKYSDMTTLLPENLWKLYGFMGFSQYMRPLVFTDINSKKNAVMETIFSRNILKLYGLMRFFQRVILWLDYSALHVPIPWSTIGCTLVESVGLVPGRPGF